MYSGLVHFAWSGEPRECIHTLGLTLSVPHKGKHDRLAEVNRAHQIGCCEMFLNTEPRVLAMRYGFPKSRQNYRARVPCRTFSNLYGDSQLRYNDPDPALRSGTLG